MDPTSLRFALHIFGGERREDWLIDAHFGRRRLTFAPTGRGGGVWPATAVSGLLDQRAWRGGSRASATAAATTSAYISLGVCHPQEFSAVNLSQV